MSIQMPPSTLPHVPVQHGPDGTAPDGGAGTAKPIPRQPWVPDTRPSGSDALFLSHQGNAQAGNPPSMQSALGSTDLLQHETPPHMPVEA
jgi:hypothetical protein